MAALAPLVTAGALYAGSSVIENEPQTSLEYDTAVNKVVAQEVIGDDLVVTLFFHCEHQESGGDAHAREVVAAVFEALDKHYRPRGVVFQYETSYVSGSESAGVEVANETSEQSVISGTSSGSGFNIYLLDASSTRSDMITESPATDCAMIDIGGRAALEQSLLVRDLGRRIALWYTLQNATWFSGPADGQTDPKVLVGDINGDGQGPDISDLVYMVDFMFGGGPQPAILQAADIVSPLGIVDIGDLVYLVDCMFTAATAPASESGL